MSSYWVHDATGRVIEPGSTVTDIHGNTGAFGGIAAPDWVDVDGTAQPAHIWNLTITSPGPHP